MAQPTSIALDSNALKALFKRYDLAVYQRVADGTLRVYVPVIVYAEQAIYPGMPVDNAVEALNAQVVSLRIDHAQHLGELWQQIPDPFRRQRKRDLWRRHKFDWLIAAMASHEGWTLVSNDCDPPFYAPGLSTLPVKEFVACYLHEDESDSIP